MRKETINVYKFEELKKDIQEKVLNKFREWETFDFLDDELQEFLEQLLKEYKIKVLIESIKLYYSLNNCQGDGVSFTGEFKYKNYLVYIKKRDYHYSHKYTVNIEIETKNGNDAKEEVYKEFEGIYLCICNEIEKIGYSIIEDTLSDESIKENIEINKYEFFENGDIFIK